MKHEFNEEFIGSLYDYAYGELQEIYDKQSENEKELLSKIAWIILTYTVINNVMDLNNVEKAAAYKKISSYLVSTFKKQSKDTVNKINSILSGVTEKSLKGNKIWRNKDDALKIVNKRFEGLHFSSRVWTNEDLVSKMLHDDIKKFLDGKINVNDIKSHIRKCFGAEKYKVDRLVESEISRIQDEITHRFIREYGVKKVIYNASLDRSCEECLDDHEKVFDVGKEPNLPRHPKCKCFLVPVLE